MKYLYIEKKQNIKIANLWPKRAMRMIDEFEAAGLDHTVVYINSFEIDFKDGETVIRFDGNDLRDYTHLIFGGHRSETRWDYQIKVMVAEYVKKYNEDNPNSPILLQNIDFILNMPYYDKLHMAMLCLNHNLPHLNTYFRRDGMYDENVDMYGGYPYITKHVLGVNDRVKKMVDGVEKKLIRKNVAKVDKASDWQEDERLEDKDRSDFFIQEFSPNGEDFRIFVSKGKVVGGWRRISLDDNFMTVGGDRKYVLENTPPTEIVDICEKASKAWGVDFMALDFIYDKDGNPQILEFSMHPGFNAYEQKCEPGEDELSQEPINVAKTTIESF